MFSFVSVEERLNSIIASMNYEGLTVTEEDIEDCKKILNGEISADESCLKIIRRYQAKKSS